MAREADVSTRVVEATARVTRWSPDLERAILAGELSAVEGSKLVSARIARAERWKTAIADAFANEGQEEQARLCRAQALDSPAKLARWLRSLVAGYTDESSDLIRARGACGAAVLGYDPRP